MGILFFKVWRLEDLISCSVKWHIQTLKDNSSTYTRGCCWIHLLTLWSFMNVLRVQQWSCSHFNSSGLNERLPLWRKLHPSPPWLTKSLSLMRPLLPLQCSRGSLLCHCLISPKHKHRRSHVPRAHPGCSQLHGWQSAIMLWRQTTYVRAILTTVRDWLQYKSYLVCPPLRGMCRKGISWCAVHKR